VADTELEDAVNRELAELRAEDRADRLRDAIEDAKRRRDIKRLEGEKTLRRLQRESEGITEDRGRGGRDDGPDDFIDRLTLQWDGERKELSQKLDLMQAQLTKQDQDALKTQLAEIRSLIGQPIGQKDPLEQLVGLFSLGRQVREGIDQMMPAPAAPQPPPIDPGLSHQQILDRERAGLEHDILRLDREAALETVKLKRDEIVAERERKENRLNGIVGAISQAGGQLAQALAPSLAAMLPGAPGNPGSGAGGAPTPTPNLPAAPIGIPFTCPAGHRNLVPLGTMVARCETCGVGPIYLQPEGLPAPAGMVRT
jgi:hypothetical protein